MSETIAPTQKLPFKMYPLNKSNSGSYSYFEASPIITFQFAQNVSRLINSNSMYLCGKMKIMHKQGKQMPANRFDLNGSATDDVEAYEQAAYIDDRIGVNSFVESVTVGDLQGSMYEQAKNYNRNLSSAIAVTNSYKSLCTYGNMSLTSCPNNDVMARECSSEIEFAIPLSCGYFQSNASIPLERGLEVKINLAGDSQVVYGLSGQNYVYQLSNVFMMGDYMMLSKPLTGLQLNYSSYHNFQNVMNSGNDHQNIQLHLSMVNNLFHNFIPANWTNNFNYNSFSTCPLLNSTNDANGYAEALMKQYNINRGAVRYPNNYPVNERVANENSAYQTIRSRHYLNSIYPYAKNKSCLVSPQSEARTDMVMARTDEWKTPQSSDQGFVRQWVKANDAAWSRSGVYEKAAHVWGIGVTLDALHVRQYSNYANASYNYSVESALDNTATNVFIFCTAVTELESSKKGRQIIAVN